MNISFQELKKHPLISQIKIHDNAVNITTKNESKDNKQKLYLSLAGLAIVGTSAILMYQNIKRGKIKTPNASSSNHITKNIYSLESIENAINKMSEEMKAVCKGELQDVQFIKFDFFQSLKNKEKDILPLDYLFKLKKFKLSGIPKIPTIINLEEINQDKAKNIAQILSDRYHTDFKSTRYTSGFVDEFFSTLNKTSQDSKMAFTTNKKHTFLNIENIDEFLSDLSSHSDKSLMEKFENIAKTNSENGLTYIVNSKNPNINSSANMRLSFSENINTKDLSNDLLHFDGAISSRNTKESSLIQKHLSGYFDAFIDWEEPRNLTLLHDCDENLASSFYNDFQKTIKGNFSKFKATDNVSELFDKISKELPKNVDLYNREGIQSFIFIEDFEKLISNADKNSPEYLKFKGFLNDCGEKFYTSIIGKGTDGIANELNNKNVLNLAFKTNFNNKQMFEDLLKQSIEKMNECDFSHIDKNEFIFSFVKPLCESQATLGNGRKIANGILLKGEDAKTRITADSIRKSLDINYKKMEFIFPNEEESIRRLAIAAEEAEIEFQKTGKRTIIEVENLDKFLTNQSDENLIKIGGFKGFVEHASENYHSTILMRTNLPYENFEDAAIGTNRFSVKLLTK